jgi:hypothetical protein
LLIFTIIFWFIQFVAIYLGATNLLVISFVDFLLFIHFTFWFFIGNFDVTSDAFEKGFVGPILGLLLFISILYVTKTVGLIGGTLWVDLCFIFGSVPLIHGILFLVYDSRRTGKLGTSFLESKGALLAKKRVFYFRLSALALVLLLCSPFVISGISYYASNTDLELERTVEHLIEKSRNDTEKTQSILQWFNRTTNGSDNIANTYYRNKENKVLLNLAGVFYIFSEQPNFGVRTIGNNPLWVYNRRCGQCGEYSALFMEMAHRANLTVRSVSCSGEDHAWDEVFIPEENEWKIIDPTAVKLPDSTGYQSSDFMERKVAGDLHQKQGNVSYVFAQYPNGTKEDITYRYTNLTNITVLITDENGLPQPNMIINVISNNRGGARDTGLNKKTNDTGQFTFTVGGGSYTFQIQRENDIFPSESYTNSFTEEQPQHNVNITVKNHSFFEELINTPLYLTLISIIIIIVVSVLITLRKRKHRR